MDKKIVPFIFSSMLLISNFCYAAGTPLRDSSNAIIEQAEIQYGKSAKDKIRIYPDDRVYVIHYFEDSSTSMAAPAKKRKSVKGKNLRTEVDKILRNDKNKIIGIQEN
jgi:hypothetical protein